MNRTLMEATRSMLHAAGLPLSFWAYALHIAKYLRNRSLTSALRDITPYHAWRGDKPDLSHLKTFGCRAYKHLGLEKRSELRAALYSSHLRRYVTEAKAWLVYDPISKHGHGARRDFPRECSRRHTTHHFSHSESRRASGRQRQQYD